MGPQLLLCLLGAALGLPGTNALVCYKGYLIHSDDRSAFPIEWTFSQNKTCQPKEGCQETLIILDSGSKIAAVINKGCTGAQAHLKKDLQHRGPPGVTIASLTKVCHSDLCNDLSSSVPLWTPPPTADPAPGGLQCPTCASLHTCPSDAPLITCPFGTTHCYSGTIQLSGGGLSHPLRVQGCVPHSGCQLLNGTKMIGPISLTESCESEGSQDTRALTCFKGYLFDVRNKLDFPFSWTATLKETCQPGERCQDTLILLESGANVTTVLSKGCQRGHTQEPLDTHYRRPPGVTITSYTHLCHFDLCNNLSSPIPLRNSLTPTESPLLGRKQCPVCMSGQACPSNATLMTCPAGADHCYSGTILFLGGDLSHSLKVQGCVPQGGCPLLNGTQRIGPITLRESCHNSRNQGPGALTCYKGQILKIGQKMAEGPKDLSTENSITCEVGEVCYETLMFTEAGSSGILVVSKGCTANGTASVGPTRIGPPGVTVVAYTRVCFFSLCNDLHSTASILKLPPPAAFVPAPGGLQCPTCAAIGFCSKADLSICPEGTSRCYKGLINLNGGGLITDMTIQGCAPKAITGCSLLDKVRILGPMNVTETCTEKNQQQDQNSWNRASPNTVQAWGMGAGLLLALWGNLPQL